MQKDSKMQEQNNTHSGHEVSRELEQTIFVNSSDSRLDNSNSLKEQDENKTDKESIIKVEENKQGQVQKLRMRLRVWEEMWKKLEEELRASMIRRLRFTFFVVFFLSLYAIPHIVYFPHS